MARPKQKDLVFISIRLRKQDIRDAKVRAKGLSIPYQHVIRGWVADAAKGVRDGHKA